jgi:hypothetical protein
MPSRSRKRGLDSVSRCAWISLEPVERAAHSLGVSEQEAVAEAGEAGDGGVEDVVQAVEGAFEEEPRRVCGTLGDQRELVLGQLERVLVGELAARVQADGDPVLFDRALRGLAATGQLGDVDPREMRALDVRGAGDVQYALGVQPAGEAPGLLHRRGPVIEPGEEMGVEIRVSHSHKW